MILSGMNILIWLDSPSLFKRFGKVRIRGNMRSLNILLPVLNEEKRLEEGILKSIEYLNRMSYDHVMLTIVDNGSTDGTREIAIGLCDMFPQVEYLRIGERGVGAAFRAGVQYNISEIVGYMDIDLSTDIEHLEEMIEAFEEDPDLFMVNGSRLSNQSQMHGRKWYRNLSSKGLPFLLKLFLGMKASDAICGFKFYEAETLRQVMAQTYEDNGWFYIIELLIRSERKGLKIKEIPVRWEDDHRTKVKFFSLMYHYMKQIMRLFIHLNFSKGK